MLEPRIVKNKGNGAPRARVNPAKLIIYKKRRSTKQQQI